MVQAGGLMPLLNLIVSNESNLQHNAAFALYGLADNADNIPAFVREGAVQILLACQACSQVQFFFWSASIAIYHTKTCRGRTRVWDRCFASHTLVMKPSSNGLWHCFAEFLLARYKLRVWSVGGMKARQLPSNPYSVSNCGIFWNVHCDPQIALHQCKLWHNTAWAL